MREGALTKRWGQIGKPAGNAIRGGGNFMCPACMASAALMAGSVISTGGIAALAVKVVRWKNNDANHDSKEIDGKEK